MSNTTNNKDSLLNKSIVDEAPDFSLVSDDFTSAVIEKPIPELNNLNWQTGIQICDRNRQPYSREFSELFFNPGSQSSLEKIDLGTYVEQYEGTFYYSVTTEFNEKVYRGTRNILDRSQDFLKWQTETVSYRHELIYTHKLIKQITWTRPLAPLPTGTGSTSTGGINNTNTNTNTGDGEGNNNRPRRYIDLPTEYIIGVLDSNKGLAAEVNCANPIEITLLNSPSDTNGEIVSDLFLLRKRYIRIKLLNVINGVVGIGSHPSLTVSFYGKYKYQVFYPKDLNKDSSYLLHRSSSTLSQRLQPPGKLFDANFWNSNPSPPPIDQYSIRKANSPSLEQNSPTDTLPGAFPGAPPIVIPASAWSEVEIEDDALNPSSSGMSRTTYDSNRSGIVDNSERLGSNSPSFYLDRSNHTGSLNISTLTTTQGTPGFYLQWNGNNFVLEEIPQLNLQEVMLKSIYDSDNNGVVNNSTNSDLLNNNPPSFYLNRLNHTGLLNISHLTSSSLNPIDIGKFLSWNGSAFVLEEILINNADMTKAIYDTNENGVVDNAERLSNQLPAYYLNRVNHTGTLNITNLSISSPQTEDIGKSLIWNGTVFVLDEIVNTDVMLKSIYDTNNSGIVDNSEKLNNNLPAYYLNRLNHTGSLDISILSLSSPSPSDLGKSLIWNGSTFALGENNEEEEMLKSVYDSNNTGIVDNAEKLNNQAGSYYLNRTNHTGSLDISNITTTVGNTGDYVKWNGSQFILEEFTTSNLMIKATYDSNNSGVVDNSEKLNNQVASYYLNRSNHTGTLDVTNLTTSVGIAGNLLRWDGSGWGAASVKVIDLADVSISSLPTVDDYYLSWDTTLDKFILKTVSIPNSTPGHIIRFSGTDFAQRSTLEFAGEPVTVTDSSISNKTIVTLTIPSNVLRQSNVGYQVDGSVAVARTANNVPWSGVTSAPTIPINLNDLTDVVITPTPTVSDAGKALIWTGTTYNIGIPLDEKPAPLILYSLASTTLRPNLNFTGAGVEIIDNPSNNALDIRITGLTSDSMAKSVYDTNDDGIVNSAHAIDGVTSASSSTYYGKNSSGTVGFHSFSSDLMTKTVYDSTNNGIVDNTELLNNQTPSYYLSRANHTGTQTLSTLSQSSATTNQSIRWSGSAWVAFTPSDMYKSTYDTNNDGVVDQASAISGVSAAANYTYYGKDNSGNIGFFAVPQTSGFGDMQKAVYDINDNGVVDDSEKLNGQSASFYLNRSNHTGNIISSVISDFSSTTKALLGSSIVSSSSVSSTYNSGAGIVSLSVIANTTVQQSEISRQGTLIGTRKRINFIEGTNITLVIADDNVNDKVDVTITSTASGGGGGGGASLTTFNTWTKAQVVQAVTLTEAATITTDASLSNNFKVTLTGSRILSNPTNLVEGGTYNWLITQNATGGWALTLGNNFVLSAGSTLGTTANARNIMSCIFMNGFLLCSIAKF